MVAMKVIAFALFLPFLSTSLINPLFHGGFNIQTTFRIQQECGKNRTAIIEQANKDALELANAVFDDCGELKTAGEVSKCINWESQAVAEYFGPKAMNRGQRERIFETFIRATKTKPTWFSDWWNARKVFVFCEDIFKNAKPQVLRIQSPKVNATFPTLYYARVFF